MIYTQKFENLPMHSPEWFAAMAEHLELAKQREWDRELRHTFESEFGPEALLQLSGRELLTRLFYSNEENKSNLCYILERQRGIRELYGSIAGGSAYKFGLFYHKKAQQWMTGSPSKPQVLTESEAIDVAASIRDKLVEGEKIIREHGHFDSIEDYEYLYHKLKHLSFIDNVWVLKYYQMLFPKVLSVFYARNFQVDVLRFLGETPSDAPLVRMGQISLFTRKCGITSVEFAQIYYQFCTSKENDPDGANALADPNENTVRYWMYAPGEGSSKWDEFYERGMMAIGWWEMGDLSIFGSKKEMKLRMKQIYDPTLSYMNAAHATWQFVNEIQVGDVVFVKRGRNQIIGRGIVESDYEYVAEFGEYPHMRHVRWTHKGEWSHPDGQAALKTLTDVTPYTDYVGKLCALFEEDADEPVVETAIDYPAYDEEDFLKDVFMDKQSYDTLVNLIRIKKNVILQVAPGVGKTFAAKRLAYSMMGVKDQERVMMVQFHQSYSYEDFIEGFRPQEAGFKLNKGAFYNFCKKAEIDSDNDYFFIIDEINRGNLSKIFGELFMLIESDKRGIQLQLLYSGEKFAVPQNVYIIGMMNTADRSLAMLDYALRRRFAFYEVCPGFDTDGFRNYRMDLSSEKFNALIHCVENLNRHISEDDSLGDGFCIGHSYFCNLTKENVSPQILSSIVEYELIPLLKEYWFDEAQKVRDWSEKLRSAVK